ncbi:MAG TPA: ATP-dependent metallopeptidase FtsH/Yme1/Tma family protein, partial [Gammaproteobacteria bacterium]|nr:ATP-dependent metallopeptidase FtsH/Yme1/Tma family protein [Gammaproteobacteria bacterium]
MERRRQIDLAYAVLAVLLIVAARGIWLGSRSIEEIPYSDFQAALADGRIAAVEVSGTTLTGDYKTPTQKGATRFVTERVPADLVHELEGRGVRFKAVPENTFVRDLLSWIVPAIAFFAIWLFVMRRFGERQGGVGGLFAIGKSRAKVYM